MTLNHLKKYFLNYKIASLIIIFMLWVLAGCKKFVTVNPPITQTTSGSVFATETGASAVLTGQYINFSKGSFATGASSISLLCGLSADEFVLSNAVSNTDKLFYYYTNALYSNPTGIPGTETWSCYHFIYICNDAIEQLNKSTGLRIAVKQQLLGESKFIRALLYFYLVNLYGPIPLAVSADYKMNSHLPRATTPEVYSQIIGDLLEAKDLLSDKYLAADVISPTSERLRPTKWAAEALLARVYLYQNDQNGYVKAEESATEVISNTALFGPLSSVSLNNVFLANSKEAIWQLQPVNSGWNTEDAKVFVINNAPSGSKPISLSQSLMNSFESGDLRKINWIKDTTIGGNKMPYPYKYERATMGDPVTEYLMVLRLGEQYLIRAEARAQLGNTVGSLSDLNAIRHRAGLGDYTGATDKNSLLAAILHERQVELFSEWGNRWLDLKRTGNVDAIMTNACVQKGGVWKSYQQLYPISYLEIQNAPQLTQNAGY